MKHPTRVAIEPSAHLLVLVGCIAIEDDVAVLTELNGRLRSQLLDVTRTGFHQVGPGAVISSRSKFGRDGPKRMVRYWLAAWKSSLLCRNI